MENDPLEDNLNEPNGEESPDNDEPSSSNQVDNSHNVISGSTFGDVAGNINIGDQHTYYVNDNKIFREISVDDLIEKNAVRPSKGDPIIQTLMSEHLIIVYADITWESKHIINYVAQQILENQLNNNKKLYTTISGVNASALEQGLRQYQPETEAADDTVPSPRTGLYDAVVLVYETESTKYSPQALISLTEIATENNLYLILETQQTSAKWGLTYQFEGIFFDFHIQSPYEDEDLTTWLINLLTDEDAPTFQLEDLDKFVKSVDETSVYPDNQLTVGQTAAALGCPGNLRRFDTRLRNLTSMSNLQELISTILTESDPLVTWFDNLSREERYIVLTVSLINGLEQKRFWSIYELLIKYSWRERDQQLVMADHQDTLLQLREYIDFPNNPAEPIQLNANVQSQILNYALKGYLRSVVNAIPLIAYLLTFPLETTGVFAERPKIGPLKLRDIFGSEYDSAMSTFQQRSYLNEQLISSIARIALNQFDTTEHLFLVWVDYGNDNDGNQSRLGDLFSRIFLRMYELEDTHQTSSQNWYEQRQTFQLLGEWYKRYQSLQSTRQILSTSIIKSSTKVQIRETLALVLCDMAISDSVSAQDFMQLGNESITDTPLKLIDDLRTHVPDRQPLASDLQSPWHMLIAFAIDPEPSVRINVAVNLHKLKAKYPQHFISLLRFMAGDINPDVRLVIASVIMQLFIDDRRNIYLITLLLNETDETTYQSQLRENSEHYLSRNINLRTDYLYTQLTATIALLLISSLSLQKNHNIENWQYLKIHMQTYLRSGHGNYFAAFQQSLDSLIAQDERIEGLKDRIAKIIPYIVRDSVMGNRTSPISVYVQSRLNRWGIQYNAQQNTRHLDPKPEGTTLPQ